jgi:hypothetical protein
MARLRMNTRRVTECKARPKSDQAGPRLSLSLWSARTVLSKPRLSSGGADTTPPIRQLCEDARRCGPPSGRSRCDECLRAPHLRSPLRATTSESYRRRNRAAFLIGLGNCSLNASNVAPYGRDSMQFNALSDHGCGNAPYCSASMKSNQISEALDSRKHRRKAR